MSITDVSIELLEFFALKQFALCYKTTLIMPWYTALLHDAERSSHQ